YATRASSHHFSLQSSASSSRPPATNQIDSAPKVIYNSEATVGDEGDDGEYDDDEEEGGGTTEDGSIDTEEEVVGAKNQVENSVNHTTKAGKIYAPRPISRRGRQRRHTLGPTDGDVALWS
ncbi:unnamed protein product, partial [Protopolystoma xenopodis]